MNTLLERWIEEQEALIKKLDNAGVQTNYHEAIKVIKKLKEALELANGQLKYIEDLFINEGLDNSVVTSACDEALAIDPEKL